MPPPDPREVPVPAAAPPPARDVAVAAVAALGLAAAAGWAVARADAGRSSAGGPVPAAVAAPVAGAPAPAPESAPEATPEAAPVAVPDTLRRGDVDGDGDPDRVDLVERGERGAADWQFGVRAALAARGDVVAWHDPGEGGNDAQAIAGFADVDPTGGREVVVLLGTSAATRYYGLVTFTGRELVRVRGHLFEASAAPGAERAWGCGRGRLHQVTTRRSGGTYRGTITYYRLRGTRLATTGRATRTWRAGERPPPGYATTTAVRCGSAR